MKPLVIGVSLVIASVVAPLAAHGQTRPPERGFVRPLVGATIGAGPGALFGGTVGVKATGKLQVTGEFGRMTNILPQSVADQIEIAAAKVADARGGKHSAGGSAKATYGLVGFRQALREVGGAQTFVEVGVGAAQVRSGVSAQIRGSETLQGDISHLVSVPFTAASPTTKPMVTIGGGLILGVTRTTAVEVGVRYARLFIDSPAINMAKVFGGFRLGF